MNDFYGLVTVRSDSNRLPKKCFLPLEDKSILENVVHRCKKYGIIPILCTTISKSDNSIEELGQKLNVQVYRGSIKNKMLRWLRCAELYSLEDFHTIDADDPFFDGNLILKSIKLRREKNLDFIKPSTYSSNGSGSVGYSISSNYLKKIIEHTDDSSDTEMINKFIESGQNHTSETIEEDPILDYQIRLTLDYIEDFWLITSISRILGPIPEREKIMKLFEENPDLHKINFFRNSDWELRQKELLLKQNDNKNS